MTAQAAPRIFGPQDIVIAVSVALLAQLALIAGFQLPPPKLVQADISNDNGQPIAVSITPVLKLGSKNPSSVPSQWQRKKATTPKPPDLSPLPSPQAAKTPDAVPTTKVQPDAGPPPQPTDSTPVASAAPDTSSPAPSGSVATASSVQGSEQGAANGTETDPLKARAADMYRAQLASWFASHFVIRGKIPFDDLKKLHASAVVTVTADRTVGSFSVVKPSGNDVFDAQVQATLAGIQGSGAVLPAPPPMYPDMLGQSLPVGFQCTVQKFCE